MLAPWRILLAVPLLLAACGGGSSSPPEYPYPPSGAIAAATTRPWEWIRDHPSLPDGCGVQDNRWNEVHALPGPRAQRVFVEDIDGTPAVGWQWLWPEGLQVVAYPEVICGTKPWDMGEGGYTLGGDFPFQLDDRTLSVDYDLHLEWTGVANVAFSLWAVSDTDHPLGTITNEIMIWVDDLGVGPAGQRLGEVTSGDSTFEVWVNPGHTDASGGSDAVWTFVAFKATTPLRSGPLDFTPLLDYLADHDLPGSPGVPILPEGAWLGALELGTEIVHGGGLMEIAGFSLQFGEP